MTPNQNNDLEAWMEVGTAHMQNDDYTEALVAFNRALQLDPTCGLAYSSKGFALGGLKRYEEAFAAFDMAIQLDPADVGAFVGKGKVLSELKLYPNDPASWQAHARIYRFQGRLREAEAAERRARELGG
jgi:tetratricopeptide (TPR) repeat protein